jgi:thioesterase domain-containing protein
VNAAAFLSELRRRDIQVSAVGGQLRCIAKTGELTPELREQLRQWKDDILKLLASAHALAAQERAIVPLQANGSRVPVFGVPGHNGDVFCYRALAQRLGEDQPFFGLQPPGLDGQDEPLTRVEDLAATFARQIRAFQPQGPYVIAGYCAGGTVAFELARQLERAGQPVSLLALFGSPHPAYFRLASRLRQRIADKVAALGTLMRDLNLAERLQKRRDRINALRAAAIDPVVVLRTKVEDATVAAVRAYEPRGFAGRVALFLPSRGWDDGEGWREVAPHAEQYAGPEHCGSQDMLREPNAAAFAALFEQALRAK